MVNIRFTTKVDDAGLRRYLKQVDNRLGKNSKSWLDNSLRKVASKARLLAPVRTGRTRKGIMITRRKNAKTAKAGNITWKELDSRRGQSFKNSKFSGNFIEWLHKGPTVNNYNWNGKRPDFMYAAVDATKGTVIKDAEQFIQKSIRRK